MVDKLKEGGKKFDVFNTLQSATADKTNVDILTEGKKSSTKGIHNALLAAGFVPGLGNIADVADATLYALEGEFGEAAWSAAAAIPVIGQMVSGKRALKAAKEAGQEMVTVYRGVPQWFKKRKGTPWGDVEDVPWRSGGMVKEGKFVGGGRATRWGETPIKKTALWVADRKEYEFRYARESSDKQFRGFKAGRPHLLEFEMPKSYFDKHSILMYGKHGKNKRIIFQEGIPKEFLKKVHNYKVTGRK